MTIADRWPLPDRRSAARIATDQGAVRQQVRSLERPGNDTTALDAVEAVVERIRRRQLTAAREHATPFVRLATPVRARAALAAEGKLVIDGDDAQLARCREILTGYEAADRGGRHPSRRRTRVFRSRNRSEEQLRAAARRLREEVGVRASVNAIVPLGYVIKGDSYPGATVAPAPFASNGATAPVRVAVIDTGMTAAPRGDGWDTGVVRDGVDPVNVIEPLDRIDWFGGHGTFATGIVRQIAPDAEVVVYRFTGSDGLGTDESAADLMLQAVDDAAGKRLIINASFGAPAVDGVAPPAMREAVEHLAAAHPEVLIVASAGNDGQDVPLYPAAFPGVTAVGALTSTLTPAPFSNKGSWVDCSTVGVGVVSTFVEGKLPPENDPTLGPDVTFGADAWATWSGTSFTAPQIAGAVAALCGEDAALQPRAALTALTAGRPTLAGYGTVVHLLPGTPI